MTKTPKLLCTAVVLLLASTTHAATRVYAFSGDMLGLLAPPVLSDPIADLLGLPRGADNNILPGSIQFTVDTDTTPFIITDTSIAQEYEYANAVTSVEINLNGTVFKNVRPLVPGEVIIGITNTIHPDGIDFLVFGFRPVVSLSTGQYLFNNYVVPFGQTIDGTFIENSTVNLSNLIVSMVGRRGFLDNASIPMSDDFLEPLPASFGIGTISLLGTNIAPFLSGTGQIVSNNSIDIIDFNISAVPEPSTTALLGLGLVGLLARGRKTA